MIHRTTQPTHNHRNDSDRDIQETTAQTNSTSRSYENESNQELTDQLENLYIQQAQANEEDQPDIEAQINAIEREQRIRRGEDPEPKTMSPFAQKNVEVAPATPKVQTGRNPRFKDFTSNELGNKIFNLQKYIQQWPDHQNVSNWEQDVAEMKAERALRQKEYEEKQKEGNKQPKAKSLAQRTTKAPVSTAQPQTQTQTQRNPRFTSKTSQQLGQKIYDLKQLLKKAAPHEIQTINQDIQAMESERAFRKQEWNSGQIQNKATTTAQTSSTLYTILAIMLACMASAVYYMTQAQSA